jgi:putative oxidoreductase
MSSQIKKVKSYVSFILFSRILLAVLFIFSGLEKLIHPPEEFMVILKGYHLLPEGLVRPMALGFPWIELLFGTFLLMGLFYRVSLLVVGGLLLTFTLAIASTLIRGIPLEDCGCFKSLGIRENGPTALARNLILLLFWLNLYFYKDRPFTLDQWLKGNE